MAGAASGWWWPPGRLHTSGQTPRAPNGPPTDRAPLGGASAARLPRGRAPLSLRRPSCRARLRDREEDREGDPGAPRPADHGPARCARPDCRCMRRRPLAGRLTGAAANAALTAARQLCAYALIRPARRGVAHPRRVLVAEDGMREEGGGDRSALIRPSPQTFRVSAVRRGKFEDWAVTWPRVKLKGWDRSGPVELRKSRGPELPSGTSPVRTRCSVPRMAPKFAEKSAAFGALVFLKCASSSSVSAG